MLLNSLFLSLIQVVQILISAYTWIIVITAFMSWINPDPRNPIVQILYKLSYPAYVLVRKIPTQIGNIDLAPLVIILILQFISILLTNLARSFL